MVAQAELARGKANITLFLPGYVAAAKPTYTSIAFLLLDQALGEYDVEMRVGEILVKPLSQAPVTASSLEALPTVFDEAFVPK